MIKTAWDNTKCLSAIQDRFVGLILGYGKEGWERWVLNKLSLSSPSGSWGIGSTMAQSSGGVWLMQNCIFVCVSVCATVSVCSTFMAYISVTSILLFSSIASISAEINLFVQGFTSYNSQKGFIVTVFLWLQKRLSVTFSVPPSVCLSCY